ncbi:MAG: hypothetical protein JW889_12475 [Verrucomicrobia bacterium]|nr:hypothetical protein [Verrucomicrobiota bacterium]
MATTTISGQLIVSVKRAFFRSLNEHARMAAEMRPAVQGINCPVHGEEAFPAYVMAVAAVEAFVNESLVSESIQSAVTESAFWELRKDWREKLPLPDKMVVAMQLHFSCTLRWGEDPLNGMRRLIRVRDELVHYKLKEPLAAAGDPIPNFVLDLVQKRVALGYGEQNHQGYAWPDLLECSEGIRWAHNTACRTAHGLKARVPAEFAKNSWMDRSCETNFVEITVEDVRSWYDEHNIGYSI